MAIQDNPFYYNYIFNKFDLSRAKIRWWQYPLLWIMPTYVQINDGMVWFYKQWGNQYFLMKYEKLGL